MCKISCPLRNCGWNSQTLQISGQCQHFQSSKDQGQQHATSLRIVSDKHVLIPHAKNQFSERNQLRDIAVDRPNRKHTSYACTGANTDQEMFCVSDTHGTLAKRGEQNLSFQVILGGWSNVRGHSPERWPTGTKYSQASSRETSGQHFICQDELQICICFVLRGSRMMHEEAICQVLFWGH